MYFQISCKNSCRKTIEATMMKKAPNVSKLIYAKIIVVSLCLLTSHGSHFNTEKFKKNHFFGDVNVGSLNKILRFMEDTQDTHNVMTSGLSP